MPHMWVQHGFDWLNAPLDPAIYALGTGIATPLQKIGHAEISQYIAVIAPGEASGNAASSWTLVCAPGACRVNGSPLLTGIAVLNDRDEIQFATAPRLFFSTETPAVAARYGRKDPVPCPRCTELVLEGDIAVICPTCGVAYHEGASAEDKCFTYDACVVCGRPGELSGGYKWSPAEL